MISKWGTGVNSIDASACSRLGIKLFRTPNAFTTPVADSVLGLHAGICAAAAVDG